MFICDSVGNPPLDSVHHCGEMSYPYYVPDLTSNNILSMRFNSSGVHFKFLLINLSFWFAPVQTGDKATP